MELTCFCQVFVEWLLWPGGCQWCGRWVCPWRFALPRWATSQGSSHSSRVPKLPEQTADPWRWPCDRSRFQQLFQAGCSDALWQSLSFPDDIRSCPARLHGRRLEKWRMRCPQQGPGPELPVWLDRGRRTPPVPGSSITEKLPLFFFFPSYLSVIIFNKCVAFKFFSIFPPEIAR